VHERQIEIYFLLALALDSCFVEKDNVMRNRVHHLYRDDEMSHTRIVDGLKDGMVVAMHFDRLRRPHFRICRWRCQRGYSPVPPP